METKNKSKIILVLILIIILGGLLISLQWVLMLRGDSFLDFALAVLSFSVGFAFLSGTENIIKLIT